MVFTDLSVVLPLFFSAYADSAFYELVPPILCFLVLDVLFHRKQGWRVQTKVQRLQPLAVIHELLYCMFGLVGGLVIFEMMHALERRDWVNFMHVSQLSLPVAGVIAFQVLFITCGFDLWFFAVHYCFHTVPFLYKYVHKAHHRSTAPTALSSVNFSPLESIIMSVGVLLLLVVLRDVYQAALIIFSVSGTLYNLVVHLGVEFFPKWWHSNRFTASLVNTTYHDEHHSKFIVNYGLYFTWWDRLMGTIADRFDERYEERWNSGKAKVAGKGKSS